MYDLNKFISDAAKKDWPTEIKTFLKNETNRAVLGGLTLGTLAFGLSYQQNKNRPHSIAFSEIEKTTRMHKYQNKAVPPLTQYYSLTHDMAMKVFEAKNLSRGWDMGDDAFAYELEKKIDPAIKVHALIPEYAAELPDDVQKAMKSIAPMAAAKNSAATVVSQLENVWDESHNDQYRTEIYYTTSCDSNGKNCTTQMHTRQVYDHTDHEYIYHDKEGVRAEQLLNKFSTYHNNIEPVEELLLVTSTEAENEQAIRNSMADKFEGRYPTQKEYNEMSNIWATGSNFSTFTPVALENHRNLIESAPLWNRARQTAHSVSYQTNSHSDDGPVEYQVIEKAKIYGQNMSDAVERITHGMNTTAEKAPLLAAKAKEFVDVSLHYKEGDAEELGEEVMDLATTIYGSNFEKGFDEEPFKWGQIALWTLFGAGAGAAGAVGAGQLHSVYEDKKRQRSSGPQSAL